MNMMADYVPRSDAEFNNWQAQNLSFAEGKSEAWKIPADMLVSLKNGQTAWDAAYVKASNRKTRSQADVEAKNVARRTYEKQWREGPHRAGAAHRHARGAVGHAPAPAFHALG